MKKTLSLLLAFFMLFVFSLSLESCSGEKGVPDSIAIESVRQNKYHSGRYPETVSVIHNKYDKEAYLDYVTIVSKSEGKYGHYVTTCDAAFQYNRTTDLWDLFSYEYISEGSYEVWTYPKYTLNDSLEGSYDVNGDYGFDRCHIEILNVTEQTIKLSYDVSADIDVLWSDDLHIEKSGTITLENGNLSGSFLELGQTTIDIPIELPEGYYEYNPDDRDTNLNIVVDLTNGVQSAYFFQINKKYN